MADANELCRVVELSVTRMAALLGARHSSQVGSGGEPSMRTDTGADGELLVADRQDEVVERVCIFHLHGDSALRREEEPCWVEGDVLPVARLAEQLPRGGVDTAEVELEQIEPPLQRADGDEVVDAAVGGEVALADEHPPGGVNAGVEVRVEGDADRGAVDRLLPELRDDVRRDLAAAARATAVAGAAGAAAGGDGAMACGTKRESKLGSRDGGAAQKETPARAAAAAAA
eukprot:CAMPEP_0195603152 /NCGR_PEP_ID=MMETSP0815-20121206/5975_1 /TAXON_ID=97485 /ORGANISM="Prymnesium parvum, Strain Texoma1" /LENGTH=229 /DNA_ID=CAMNT_0040742759 /DNA_START=164 /DNA_END=852 /DNA_ORIENTATION=-